MKLDQESIVLAPICDRVSVLVRALCSEEVQNSVHLAWLSAIAGAWMASTAFFINSALARLFCSANSTSSPTRFCARGKKLLAVRVAELSCSCHCCAQEPGLNTEPHQRP